MVRDYGVDYMQFRHFETYSSATGRLSILETKSIVPFDYGEFSRMLEECRNLETPNFRVSYNQDKMESISTGVFLPATYTACHGSQFTGAIAATGDVYICCVLKGDINFSFGRLTEKSFHEIWNGRRRQEVMRNLTIKRDCVPFCRCDSMNRFLEPLATNALHVNFM